MATARAVGEAEEGGARPKGSSVMGLVGNEEAFSSFVEDKFRELRREGDEDISMRDLQPAVAGIGAALGLPAQGASPDSDQIYSEVLNDLAHASQERVSRTEFKEVVFDLLVGMAVGLKRDPIVILRMDGEDLLEFVTGQGFHPYAISIFAEIESPHESLHELIIKAFQRLTVEKGMPPASDSWVAENVVEPVLQRCGIHEDRGRPVSPETFLPEFRKAAEGVGRRLKEQPVIVAHYENTFDGGSVARLLSNKFELDRSLEKAIAAVPKDSAGKKPLRAALDALAPFAGLTPPGAITKVDEVAEGAVKEWVGDNVGGDERVEEGEMKRAMSEILGRIMARLQARPIRVSSNSVIHEPLASSSIFSATSSG